MLHHKEWILLRFSTWQYPLSQSASRGTWKTKERRADGANRDARTLNKWGKNRSEGINLSENDGLLPHAPPLPPLLASWARLILSSGIHKAPSSDARLLSSLSGLGCEALLLWGSLSPSYFVTTLPPTSTVGVLKWYGMAKRRKGDWSLLLVWSPPTRMFVFLWKESFSRGNAQILQMWWNSQELTLSFPRHEKYSCF